MNSKDRMMAGCRRGAQTNREKAIDSYYRNPSVCLYCGQIIRLKPGTKPSLTRQKKFCDRSCAAKYNNRKFPKREATKESQCSYCGTMILLKQDKKGHYRKRKYCDDCAKLRTSFSRSLGTDFHVDELTKAQLKERSDYKYYYRNIITARARKTYYKVYKKECIICDYNIYVEVCHLRAVRDFPDSATVGEINSLDNLVCLCPTHHKELDLKVLNLTGKEKVGHEIEEGVCDGKSNAALY